MIYTSGHDPTMFVIYSGDVPSYAKIVFSQAEADRLLAALIIHLQNQGRNIHIVERLDDPPEAA